MNATKRSIFPLLSGLLLFLSWPDRGLNFLVFGALLPWLLVLDDLEKPQRGQKTLSQSLLPLLVALCGVQWGHWMVGRPGALERSGGHGLHRRLIGGSAHDALALGFPADRRKARPLGIPLLLDHPRVDPEQLGHGMALAQARLCTGRSGGSGSNGIQ